MNSGFNRKIRMPKNNIIVIFIAALLAVSLSYGYPQGAGMNQKPQKVKGQISSVDWVGSNIIVRWYDDTSCTFDSLSIFIPDNAKIIKNGVEIKLGDVNISDKVEVEFYDASFGPLKAVLVTIKKR